MNLWMKFGCKLTGWDARTLSQCSEASRSQLSKYTSALLILIMIWGVTGFCFAQRYVGLPSWACVFVSLFFVTIVIMVERQIILATKRSWQLIAFRGLIAVVMAIVGSTIIDQTMFGKDIDKQLADNIEVQTAALTQKRVSIIDGNLLKLRAEIDSMEKVNAALQEDVNAHPLISQKTVTNSSTPVATSDGKIKTVSTPSVSTTQIANPKQAILVANQKNVNLLREQEQKIIQQKQTVESDTRQECRNNVGFLEELEAMWTIVTTRPVAAIFYGVFFLLLVSLELFVAVSKFCDQECDYEAVLVGAQRARMAQLEMTFNRIRTV